MRQAVTVLIAIATTALILAASSAQATVDFDGPQAAGATFGAGLVTGIACWTLELAMGEEEERHGEVNDDFDRRGWYAGIEGVYAYEDVKEGKEEEDLIESHAPFNVTFSLDSDHTGGLNFKVGRRCHPRIAVEIEIEWIDEFEGTVKEPTAGDVTKLSFSPILVGTVNLKGYLLTGRFQPYALFGMGTMSVKSESRSISQGVGVNESQTTGLFALRFGGGIDIYATRNWVVTGGIDYVYAATSIQHVNYLSVALGVQYRF
ncbi:MAG: porin family protein [Deltaproteobacteria bacterium]|nr:porin family protein [Deltaproteobacteria bacterium]